MSTYYEKTATRIELVPSVVALVLSLAVTFVGAYGFATGTGAKAVQSFEQKGIITVTQTNG
jgi:hypothetical protein